MVSIGFWSIPRTGLDLDLLAIPDDVECAMSHNPENWLWARFIPYLLQRIAEELSFYFFCLKPEELKLKSLEATRWNLLNFNTKFRRYQICFKHLLASGPPCYPTFGSARGPWLSEALFQSPFAFEVPRVTK